MRLFRELMSGPGIPEGDLRRAQGFNRSELLAQERRRIERRGDEFSGRGLFGSGLSERGTREIEADTQQEIGRSATALSLEDARLSAQGRQTAASLGLGIGNLGLDSRRINLAGLLGFGDLDLRSQSLAMQRALQELEANLLLGGTVLGGTSDAGTTTSSASLGDAGSTLAGIGGTSTSSRTTGPTVGGGLPPAQSGGQPGLMDFLLRGGGGHSKKGLFDLQLFDGGPRG